METELLNSLLKDVFPGAEHIGAWVALAMLIGRGIKAVRENHGVVGWFRSVLYGSSYLPGNRPDPSKESEPSLPPKAE